MVTLPRIMVEVSKRNRRSMRRVCTSTFVPARETGCSKRIQARCERDAVMFRSAARRGVLPNLLSVCCLRYRPVLGRPSSSRGLCYGQRSQACQALFCSRTSQPSSRLPSVHDRRFQNGPANKARDLGDCPLHHGSSSDCLPHRLHGGLWPRRDIDRVILVGEAPECGHPATGNEGRLPRLKEAAP